MSRARQQTQKAEVWDVEDDWVVRFFYKEGDYNYKSGRLGKTNEWLKDFVNPLQYQKYTPDGVKVEIEGPAFQIVAF